MKSALTMTETSSKYALETNLEIYREQNVQANLSREKKKWNKQTKQKQKQNNLISTRQLNVRTL